MSENDTKTDYGTWSNPANSKKISRRELIGAAVKAVAAATVLSQPGAHALADWVEGGVEGDIKLPADILSNQELEATYRTRIHDLPEAQFPDDYVELFFRRSASETTLFQRLESGRIIGLDVVLVNHSTVDLSHLTRSQQEMLDGQPSIAAGLQRQIDRVQEINLQEIEENRDSMRLEYQEKVSELDSRKPDMSEDRYKVELQALDYSYGRYLTEEPSSSDLEEIGMRGYAPMNGTASNDRGEQGPRSFIFLAVRDREKTKTFVSGSDSITVPANRIPYGNDNSIYAPHPEQSFPKEADFDILAEPNELGYVVVDKLTPGFILRHESRHAQGVLDEESADKGALEGIVEAANHMAETGSDEKYWAVFRTPDGVTITKRTGAGTT
ncbi:hypothetical protein C4564_05055 [Candidatus Microgenomates bacterium]|nr:MAG: hypothetical protein C4564_05055 [Candidatus Microgenomates bacterium]